jgi:hypothetical protein
LKYLLFATLLLTGCSGLHPIEHWTVTQLSDDFTNKTVRFDNGEVKVVHMDNSPMATSEKWRIDVQKGSGYSYTVVSGQNLSSPEDAIKCISVSAKGMQYQICGSQKTLSNYFIDFMKYDK